MKIVFEIFFPIFIYFICLFLFKIFLTDKIVIIFLSFHAGFFTFYARNALSNLLFKEEEEKQENKQSTEKKIGFK